MEHLLGVNVHRLTGKTQLAGYLVTHGYIGIYVPLTWKKHFSSFEMK